MGVDLSESHEVMDRAQHEETYAGFVKGVVLVTTFLAVVLILMAIFLV